MIRNKRRLIRNVADTEGFELDYVEVNNVKPVNIHLKESLDSNVRNSLIEGVNALNIMSMEINLENDNSAGKVTAIFDITMSFFLITSKLI